MDKIHVFNALKEYKNFSSMAEFARYLGIKAQALSNWYTRNTFDIHILSDKFPEIDANWLLRGEDPMLKADSDGDVKVSKAEPSADGLPLVPIEAVAGFNGDDMPGVRLIWIESIF